MTHTCQQHAPGTKWCYTNHGCRCHPCREASTARNRLWRARTRGGLPTRAERRADRLEQVATLHAQGLNDQQIAAQISTSDRQVLRDRRDLNLPTRHTAHLPEWRRRTHGAGVTNLTKHAAFHAQACTADPQAWDAPEHDNPHRATRDETARIQAALDQCATCPVLAACTAYLAAWPHPDGVVAGRVFRDGLEVWTPRKAAS